MPNLQLINLNGVGTFVPVSATIFARYLQLQEDGTGSGAGLKVKWPYDNFTQVYVYPPSQQPIKPSENPETLGSGGGQLIGEPVQTGQYAKAATVYCQVASAGAATVLRVDERE